MPGESDTGREVVVTRRAAHSGYIKISLLRVATKVFQNRFQVMLRFGVMNECRLQLTEDARVLFDLHIILRRSGVEAAKRVFDHRSRELGKSENARPRAIDEQLSIVQLLTPDIIGDV